MKYAYKELKFQAATLAMIETANEIIAEYQAKGFSLTLRQLYYQFVARGLLANEERTYKRLGSTIADARMAGLVDWDAITDRTRFLRTTNTWDSPKSIISACASQFKFNLWEKQPYYIEVFIEKDALIGVIEGVCTEFRVPYLACRGYASASEIHDAGNYRFRRMLNLGKKCCVLYLGDHDPSGLDMTRDVRDRLDIFTRSPGSVEVVRLALNMDQIEEHTPPPNPTKMTDSRAEAYVDEFGAECWELDALEPDLIADLIRNALNERIDLKRWRRDAKTEETARKQLGDTSSRWPEVVDFLKR